MKRTFPILILALILSVTMTALPVFAQGDAPSIQQAAAEVEAAIKSAMSQSGTGNGPTLGQLGGVQAGSTASDAGGDAGGGSDGSGGGCFAPETLVLMSDGTSKPIKDIKVGDKVASWDFGKKSMVTVTVKHIYTVQRDHHYIVDGIRVTAEHPYCTAPGQYTEVRSLKKGTPIASVTDDGVKFSPIADFAKVDEAGTFYNMTVTETHTYMVQSAKGGTRKLVHNKSDGCFAPETLVLMSDGISKPIKVIKVGDKVASWDFGKNAMVTVTVEHIYTVQRDHHYIVDGIRVTAEHPYCTEPGQYTEVQSLKKGTPIASVTDGGVKFVPVADFTKVDEAGIFFNMTVTEMHTYIVSPALGDGSESGEREREDWSTTREGNKPWYLVHNKGRD